MYAILDPYVKRLVLQQSPKQPLSTLSGGFYFARNGYNNAYCSVSERFFFLFEMGKTIRRKAIAPPSVGQFFNRARASRLSVAFGNITPSAFACPALASPVEAVPN